MVFVTESWVSDVYSYRHLKPSTDVSVDFGSGFFLMYVYVCIFFLSNRGF